MSDKTEQQAVARLDLARHIANYLAQVDPSGFAVLTLELVERLRNVDVAAYGRLNAGMAAHALGTGALLDRPGSFCNALAELKQKLAAGNAEQAIAITESMGHWIAFIEAVAAGSAPDNGEKIQIM